MLIHTLTFYTVRPLLCRTPRSSQIFWTVAARWRSQLDNSRLVKRASGFSVKIVPFEQCSNYPRALLYAFGSMSSNCKLVLRNKPLAFGQGYKPRKWSWQRGWLSLGHSHFRCSRNYKRNTTKCESIPCEENVSLTGGFRRWIEIKNVGDGHESHIPVLHFKNYLMV